MDTTTEARDERAERCGPTRAATSTPCFGGHDRLRSRRGCAEADDRSRGRRRGRHVVPALPAALGPDQGDHPARGRRLRDAPPATLGNNPNAGRGACVMGSAACGFGRHQARPGCGVFTWAIRPTKRFRAMSLASCTPALRGLLDAAEATGRFVPMPGRSPICRRRPCGWQRLWSHLVRLRRRAGWWRCSSMVCASELACSRKLLLAEWALTTRLCRASYKRLRIACWADPGGPRRAPMGLGLATSLVEALGRAASTSPCSPRR